MHEEKIKTLPFDEMEKIMKQISHFMVLFFALFIPALFAKFVVNQPSLTDCISLSIVTLACFGAYWFDRTPVDNNFKN
jgi:hypothetical protein